MSRNEPEKTNISREWYHQHHLEIYWSNHDNRWHGRILQGPIKHIETSGNGYVKVLDILKEFLDSLDKLNKFLNS